MESESESISINKIKRKLYQHNRFSKYELITNLITKYQEYYGDLVSVNFGNGDNFLHYIIKVPYLYEPKHLYTCMGFIILTDNDRYEIVKHYFEEYQGDSNLYKTNNDNKTPMDLLIKNINDLNMVKLFISFGYDLTIEQNNILFQTLLKGVLKPLRSDKLNDETILKINKVIDNALIERKKIYENTRKYVSLVIDNCINLYVPHIVENIVEFIGYNPPF